MWSTHPPSYEREANCKRRYVDSDRDDVRAWVLFEQADALREQLTIASLKSDKATAASKEESLLAFARTYERPSLDRSYQGAYLWRPVARIANEAAASLTVQRPPMRSSQKNSRRSIPSHSARTWNGFAA